MDLRKQTELMVKYMLSAEKESVEDKEIVDSYVDAMMLMYKEYEVSKNESLHLVSHQRELLKSFCKYIDLENSAHPDDIKIDIENHLKIFNCG